MNLTLLPDLFSVVRLSPANPLPTWVDWSDALVSITRTAEEVSVLCPTSRVPGGENYAGKGQHGFRAFKVQGPLDFALTGILATLTTVLAQAEVPVFALSTFDTDYLLVREAHVGTATLAWVQAGHAVAR